MQRALILQPEKVIGSSDLCMDGEASAAQRLGSNASEQAAIVQLPEVAANDLGQDLQNREFQLIFDTLRDQRGNRTFTAKKLGISARTLRYKLAKMRDHGINVDDAQFA